VLVYADTIFADHKNTHWLSFEICIVDFISEFFEA